MSEREIELPIRAVTVFEDRAAVERRATVELEPGQQTLVIRGVSALTEIGRTVARCDGTARIEDVQLEARWAPAQDPDEDAREALSQALRDARRAVDVAETTQGRCEERAAAADALLDQYSGEVGRAVWRASGEAWRRWLAGLEQLEDAALRADEALRAAELAHREAARAYDERAAALKRFEQSELRASATLRVSVHSEDGAPTTLVVRSVLPCAAWRPTHEAALDDGVVRWRTHGTVWQNTGEDWHGVALILSTDRPSAGAELPPLEPDVLRLQERAQKKRVELEARNVAVSRDSGTKAQGVYDGGEPRRYRARATVISNGRPHRVATGAFESPARVSWVSMPSESEHVFLRATLSNGDAPLLAGPVTLIRGGAYAGVSDIPYVDAGERFELAFGSDDRVQVIHRRRQVAESRVLGRDRKNFVTRVVFDSTAPEPIAVEVVLRMPVSEVAALSVVPAGEHCSEGVPEPDEDGLVRLPISVEPGARREVSLGFRFETSGDVVLADPW